MQIIPVIDLKNGLAVHARGGARADYAPLVTRFSASPEPAAVVTGLLEALDIDAVYIADLDALTGGTPQSATVRELADRAPDLTLLVDGGFANPRALDDYLALPNVDLVVASESINSLDDYLALTAAVPPRRTLLSLDRHDGRRLGCDALFDAVQDWPPRVIHMNLSRVGADAGPDWEGLRALIDCCAGRAVLAAGGVRDRRDLERLAALGVVGVLVGSALHDGRIAPDDVRASP